MIKDQNKINKTFSILSFILSIFVAPVGLAVAIMGLSKVDSRKAKRWCVLSLIISVAIIISVCVSIIKIYT